MTSSLGYVGIDPDEVYTAQNVTDGEVPHKLGTIASAFDSSGRFCVYKFVQYDSGTGSVAAVAGNVVSYYLVDGYKTHIVTTDHTDANGDMAAGVLVSVIADGGQGWIQVKGFTTLNQSIAGTPTAGTGDGEPLYWNPSGTDGQLTFNHADERHSVGWAGDASDQEMVCDFPY